MIPLLSPGTLKHGHAQDSKAITRLSAAVHRPRATPLEAAYPQVARWVQTHGWIERGIDYTGHPTVKALDEGGNGLGGSRSRRSSLSRRALFAGLNLCPRWRWPSGRL